MSTVHYTIETVQPEGEDTTIDMDAPYEPTPEEWREYCTLTRDESPDPPSDRPTHLPAAQWFACQVAIVGRLSRETDDFYDLIACAFSDVRIALERTRATSARELIAVGPLPYSTIDLDAVRVPADRHTHLADLFDEQAEYYLALGTDLGKLAAWAILQHADGCEYHGARTLVEYLDSDAAFHQAALAAYDEFGPTW